MCLLAAAATWFPCCPAGDFLEVVTKAERVVCHFFHRDFERCKILDKHLAILARKYFDTRFIKLSAPVRPQDIAVATA